MSTSATTSASRPSPAQAAFLVGMVAAGGTNVGYSDLPSIRRLSSPTIWACRAAGWLEGDPDSSASPPWNLTNEGRTAANVMTTSEVAQYLGMSSPASARPELKRWGVKPVGRVISTGQKLWPADVIRAKAESRPGRGARSNWLVLTMDEGVVHRASRYATAASWTADRCGGRRPRRIKSGLYEVNGDSSTTYYLATPERAAADGWKDDPA